ncbi:MAG: hypothetical protein HY680_02565 [Chloroflexi bacterium]|nr:hypothetical protein [Chloroflexota bacterium]
MRGVIIVKCRYGQGRIGLLGRLLNGHKLLFHVSLLYDLLHVRGRFCKPLPPNYPRPRLHGRGPSSGAWARARGTGGGAGTLGLGLR